MSCSGTCVLFRYICFVQINGTMQSISFLIYVYIIEVFLVYSCSHHFLFPDTNVSCCRYQCVSLQLPVCLVAGTNVSCCRNQCLMLQVPLCNSECSRYQ